MKKTKTIYLSKHELMRDCPADQTELLVAWEYSRLWPDLFLPYRYHDGPGGSMSGARLAPQGKLPAYAMTFLLSKHWPKRAYLDLTTPQRVEAFPNAPCFQKDLRLLPAIKNRIPSKSFKTSESIRMMDLINLSPLDQNILDQALRFPKWSTILLLLDTTFPKEEIEKCFKSILEKAKPDPISPYRHEITCLALYKAFRAGWNSRRAIQPKGITPKENYKAMVYCWRKATSAKPEDNITESIVPVTAPNNRRSFAKQVGKLFKKLFEGEGFKISISKGPFFKGFKIS
jgi:hypothetical protein